MSYRVQTKTTILQADGNVTEIDDESAHSIVEATDYMSMFVFSGETLVVEAIDDRARYTFMSAYYAAQAKQRAGVYI